MNAIGDATIVLIDDDEMSRFSLQNKLTKVGYNVISLNKAEDALYLLKNKENKIDLVITDVKLRKMDGIEFMRHLSVLENNAPVLILSREANVEDAIKALRFGAVDFVRKPCDYSQLLSTIRGILRQKQEEMVAIDFGKYIIHDTRKFSIPMDMTIANHLAFKLTKNLPFLGLCNMGTADNILTALREALTNAMFHGNLEISSKLREELGVRGYNEEIEKRKKNPKYANRRVSIHYELTPDYVEYMISDEGPGFNYMNLPDPRDPENFFKNNGRGIFIIKIHFDEVKWNNSGNIITMRKYKIKS